MNDSATVSASSGARIGSFRATNRGLYSLIWLLVHSLGVTTSLMAETPPDTGIDFNRSIRPILSNHCFQCHGPDAASREANLRLDQRDDATRDRRDGPAISPGDVDASAAISRIRSSDPNVQMPPPEAQKRLTTREIELLEAWVEDGAPYDTHWAFQPINETSAPRNTARNHARAWPKNPIDAFVLRQLQSAGFSPSPEANPSTLARRLSLDIVGLAPDPGRVAQFEADYRRSPDAAVQGYTRELLSSPHYGERWGRHWLDQARYADSHGYTIDGKRAMWPYRDWVIWAINQDMPFDQFTIEQLAGDLLDSPTKSQLVATGFHRNTLINQEGGSDAEQFRNEAVVDRVNTTGAVWLGLTLGCAQCHNHKFDPISQKEYYELFAFFNQSADVNNTGPTIPIHENEVFITQTTGPRIAEWRDAESALEAIQSSRAERQRQWEASFLESNQPESETPWKPRTFQSIETRGPADVEPLSDGSILIQGGAPKEIYTLTLSAPESDVDATIIQAIRLRVLPHHSLPQNGPGSASNGNFLVSEVALRFNEAALPIDRIDADHAQPNYPISNVIDGDKTTGWAINVGPGSPPGTKMNAAHEAHFVLESPIDLQDGTLQVVIRHDINENYNIGRLAIDVSPRRPDPIRLEALRVAATTPTDERSTAQNRLLERAFTAVDTPHKNARRRVAEAKNALGLGKAAPAMIYRDQPKKRETYIHERGDFLRKDKETGPLDPGVPSALPELQTTATTPSRLDLAKWLVDNDHPLTARVTVNRVWMRYFGRGIVETENDFGYQGDTPSHPELLDWLAAYFMNSGWSMKALHELIATSATYRQSSQARPDVDGKDPLNRLLARQNRLRVDAEIVRDLALSSSGLLHRQIGGPSVHPPQPSGIYAFTQRKVNWEADTNANRYRRTLYTQFYRSAPFPMLTTFDAPDFQSVCTRRPRSNTPLQSLTLANDSGLVETMKALAARLLTEIPGDDAAANAQRVGRAFRLLYARVPDPVELNAVTRFLSNQRQAFENDLRAARALAPTTFPDTYSVAQAAAWTSVARALMNTDEYITRE